VKGEAGPVRREGSDRSATSLLRFSRGSCYRRFKEGGSHDPVSASLAAESFPGFAGALPKGPEPMARRIDQVVHLYEVADRLPLHMQTCLLTNADQRDDTGHH
jgi:hypothetical protein